MEVNENLLNCIGQKITIVFQNIEYTGEVIEIYRNLEKQYFTQSDFVVQVKDEYGNEYFGHVL